MTTRANRVNTAADTPDPRLPTVLAGARRRWAAWRAAAVTPRVMIVRLLPVAGGGLIAALTAVNVLLGLLPVGFVLATSVMKPKIGRAHV